MGDGRWEKNANRQFFADSQNTTFGEKSMNPLRTPDFLLRYRLAALAEELFVQDHWIQPTNLDEDLCSVISEMVDVGLVDRGITLSGGVQIVCYRLRETV